METVVHSKPKAEFTTITCLEWKHLLKEDWFKDIIMHSLAFLSKENRITAYAFVIMSNHMHIIWQIMGNHKREDVQRDLLKFTAQQILKVLRNEKARVQDKILVNAKDRKYQVWERNSLSIPIISDEAMWQMIDYIHNNPVKARGCDLPEEYKYSSASFYINGEQLWEFLVRCDR
jgi:REP element-mobilizing transposase RayT